MKRSFEKVINKLNEPEKTLLFGEDSKIKINNVDHQREFLSERKSKIYAHQDHHVRCLIFKTRNIQSNF